MLKSERFKGYGIFERLGKKSLYRFDQLFADIPLASVYWFHCPQVSITSGKAVIR